MVKKHPAVTEKGSKIDLSDVLNDPIVAFQRRYYLVLGLICWGLIPTYLGVYLFNERPLNSFLFNVIFRYVFVLNGTWNVNSAAHIFGNRPYNVKINPRENKAVTYLSFGEGKHSCLKWLFVLNLPLPFRLSQLPPCFSLRLLGFRVWI